MLILLPILFAMVAFLYAMAGFGGGSTYIALLAISGLPLSAIPIISLSCNLVVTAQGSLLLIKRGHAHWQILTPLLLASVPCAFIGGAWRLPQTTFLGILAGALTVAGVAMLAQGRLKSTGDESLKPVSAWALLATGAILGLLAGVTGIGGGIYLAPIMHLFRWAKAHTIATCTSLFIAFNSLAGLIGQLSKGEKVLALLPLWLLLLCPVMVLIGGRLGTKLLSEKLPHERVRLLTAVVILMVAIRLWLKLWLD